MFTPGQVSRWNQVTNSLFDNTWIWPVMSQAQLRWKVSVRRKDTWQHQEMMGSIRLLQRLPNSSPQQWQLGKNGSVIALLSAPSHGQGTPSYETVLYRFTLSWIEGCPLKNRKTSSCWELQTLNRWDGWSSEQNFVSWPNLEECVRHQIQLLWFKRAAILRNILSFWLHTQKN